MVISHNRRRGTLSCEFKVMEGDSSWCSILTAEVRNEGVWLHCCYFCLFVCIGNSKAASCCLSAWLSYMLSSSFETRHVTYPFVISASQSQIMQEFSWMDPSIERSLALHVPEPIHSPPNILPTKYWSVDGSC